MKTEAETGAMHPPAKGAEDGREPGGWRSQEGSCPTGFRGSATLPTPWFWMPCVRTGRE